MTFQFRPAVREQTSVLIAIAGGTGSGKTFSALQLATGLAGEGGRIALIDTEAGRALHYADKFKFDHCDLAPPFRPSTYREAIIAADKAGYDVIVIDSMSHEYEGEGGIQDWAAELEAAGTKSPANWKEPKQEHKRMVNRLLQCRAHLIFCLRAEEKMLVTAEPQFNNDGSPRMWNGKQATKMVIVPAADRPVSERWQPLCEKRFMYEMTASFLMLADQPGVPLPIKLQDQHRFAFPDGKTISQQSGALLSTWAHGGKPVQHRARDDIDKPAEMEAAEAAARQGTEAFRAWWNSAEGKNARAAVKSDLARLQRMANDADAGVSDEDEDPFTGASAEDDARSTAHSSANEADQAQAEPQDQHTPTDNSPPSDAGSAAEGDQQGDMLGGDQLTGLERFLKTMNSLANTGAIDAEIRKQGAWYETLDDDEKMQADAAVEKARERAAKREKR